MHAPIAKMITILFKYRLAAPDRSSLATLAVIAEKTMGSTHILSMDRNRSPGGTSAAASVFAYRPMATPAAIAPMLIHGFFMSDNMALTKGNPGVAGTGGLLFMGFFLTVIIAPGPF